MSEERKVNYSRKLPVTLIGKVRFRKSKDGKTNEKGGTWEYDTGKSKVEFGDLGQFYGIKASANTQPDGSKYMGTRIPFNIEIAEELNIRCVMSQWLNPSGRDGVPLGFTTYLNGLQKTVPFKDRVKSAKAFNMLSKYQVGLNLEDKDEETGVIKTRTSLCLFDFYNHIRTNLKDGMWVKIKGNWDYSLMESEDGTYSEGRSLNVVYIEAIEEPASGKGAGGFTQDLLLNGDSWQWNPSQATQGIQTVNAKVIYQGAADTKGPHAYNFKFDLKNNPNNPLPLDRWKAILEKSFGDIAKAGIKAVNWEFRIEGGSSTIIGTLPENDAFAGFSDDDDDLDLEIPSFTQEKFVFKGPTTNQPKKTWVPEDYYVSVLGAQNLGEEIDLTDDIDGDMFGGSEANPFGVDVEVPKTASEVIAEPIAEITAPPSNNPLPTQSSVEEADPLDDLFS